MLGKWKKLRLVQELKNPWWTSRTEEYELPSGTKGEYHYVHTSGSSLTIPILVDGRIVLVRQYRYLCDRESLEFPCGGVEEGSTYEATARMELEEETGFAAEDLIEVGEFNPYNGVTDEFCKIYVAGRLSPVRTSRDVSEQFERIFLTPDEIEKKARSGEIWDGMTLAAWLIARHRLPA